MLDKQTRKNLQSRYIGIDTADTLSCHKMVKTLFRNQLHHIGSTESQYCVTCTRENNQDIIEDLTHATYTCPHIQTIIEEVTNTYFPNIKTNCKHKDTLLSIIRNTHPLYEGKPGQTLASLIWDHFLQYIMTSRGKTVTPIPAAAIFEIKSQINRSLKILPKTMVSKHVLNCNNLKEMFQVN